MGAVNNTLPTFILTNGLSRDIYQTGLWIVRLARYLHIHFSVTVQTSNIKPHGNWKFRLITEYVLSERIRTDKLIIANGNH